MYQIDNHEEESQKAIIPYLLAFDKIQKLAKYSGTRAQYLEDILWKLIYSSDIETANGIWLDFLGKKVGKTRTYFANPSDAFTFNGLSTQGFGQGKFLSSNGETSSTKILRSNADYRNAIKAKIIQNNTDCNIYDLIKACKLLFNAPIVLLNEAYPAGIDSINMYGSTLLESADAYSLCKLIMAAGVSLGSVNFFNLYNLFKNNAFISYDSLIPTRNDFSLDLSIVPDSVTVDDKYLLSQTSSWASDYTSITMHYNSEDGVVFGISPEYYNNSSTGLEYYTNSADIRYAKNLGDLILSGGTINANETNTIKLTRDNGMFQLSVNDAVVDDTHIVTNLKSTVSSIDNIKGLYVFDQNSGTTVPDLSGNGNDIVLSQDASTLNPNGRSLDFSNGATWTIPDSDSLSFSTVGNTELVIDGEFESKGLGAELITNGSFDSDTSGWTTNNSTISSVSGGQSGNCVQIVNTSNNFGDARQSFTTEVGKTYKLSFYQKNGTSFGIAYLGTTNWQANILSIPNISNTDWTLITQTFVATSTTTWLRLQLGSVVVGGTVYFDEISCKEVLDYGVELISNGKFETLGYGTELISNGTFTDASYGSELVTNGNFDTSLGLGSELITNGSFDATATYGSELITNGSFTSDVSGWSAGNGATTLLIASGQSGNGLQITNGSNNWGYAYQAITTVIGKTYELNMYHKDGTYSGVIHIGTSSTDYSIYTSGSISDSSWTKYTVQFTATSTTTYIGLQLGTANSGYTTLFDEISVKERTDITANWLGNPAQLSIVPNGQSGNCLQVKSLTASYSYAQMSIPVTTGKTYSISVYHKNGSDRGWLFVGSTLGGTDYSGNLQLNDATWTQKTVTFTATNNTVYITLGGINTAGATTLFDEISCKQVLDYGTELITNGKFSSDTTGWTASNSTLASTSGGQSGNCLQITRTATGAGYTYQSISTIVGKTYEVSFYYKDGTFQGGFAVSSSTGATAHDLVFVSTLNATSWTKYTYTFTATTTTTYITLWNSGTGSANDTALFDEVSVREKLDITGSWLGANGCQLSIASSGQSGNCLQVKNASALYSYAYQAITTVIGKTYEISFYYKDGSVGSDIYIGTTVGGYNLGNYYTSNASWSQKKVNFTATATTTYISFVIHGNTIGNYALLDEISVKEAVGLVGWKPTNAYGQVVSGGQSGNCLMLTSYNASSGGMYQVVTTEVGKTYEINFYYKSGTNGAYVRIGNGVQYDNLQIYAVGNASWTLQTGRFVASTTSTYINMMVNLSAGNQTCYYDGISVKEVKDYGLNILSNPSNFSSLLANGSGTNQMYGTNLITNGAFSSDATSWNVNNATATSVSGGQSGNCLSVANTTTISGGAYQGITCTIGKTYMLSFYHKNGTANGYVMASSQGGNGDMIARTSLNDASWTLKYYYFTATTSTIWIGLGVDTIVSGDTSLFDEVSVQEVLPLSAWLGTNVQVQFSVGYCNGQVKLYNSTTANGYITQSFTTVVGKTYDVQFLHWNNSSTSGYICIGTSANGEQNFAKMTLDDANATTRNISFTATATTTYITLGVNSTTTGVWTYFDDIFVREYLPVAGWGCMTNPTIQSVSGGQNGNCLQISNNNVGSGSAYINITTVIGKTYELSFYHKNGTSQYSYVLIDAVLNPGYFPVHSTWTKCTYTFTAVGTSTRIYFNCSSANCTTLYDEISCKEYMQLTNWVGNAGAGGTSIAGGQNNNCLQVNNNTASGGYYTAAITTTIGQGYELNVYHKNGTVSGGLSVGTTSGGNNLVAWNTFSDTNWTNHKYTFKATTTTTYINLGTTNTTIGANTLFDCVSVRTINDGPFSILTVANLQSAITNSSKTGMLLIKNGLFNEYQLNTGYYNSLPILEGKLSSPQGSVIEAYDSTLENYINKDNLYVMTYDGSKNISNIKLYQNDTLINNSTSATAAIYGGMSNGNGVIGNYTTSAGVKSNIGKYKYHIVAIIKEQLTPTQVATLSTAVQRYIISKMISLDSSASSKLYLGVSANNFYNSGSIYNLLLTDDTNDTIIINDNLKKSTIGINNGVKFI